MTIRTPVVIIGAGPVGLFQIFELGLLGIQAHVIDSIDQPGGQCMELYPHKPIYDIPALPSVTGAELTERLMQQSSPFNPTFHLGQTVEVVEPCEEGKQFYLRTSKGTEFLTDAVIIAAGLGAFCPRKLGVDGLAPHEGKQIHYSVRDPERFRGRDLVIFGGGDSALDWTLALQPIANSVVLVHRSEDFRAAPASVAKMHELCDNLEMQMLVGTATHLVEEDGQLKGIAIRGGDGVVGRLDADDLLVFFGLTPELGPIAEWGLNLHKSQIVVDTEKFQTSVPGIYAVGDINTYPGKKKLILSGFHEAALAAFSIKARLEPGRKVHLQYTTTSPIMHKRLGVSVDLSDLAD